MKERGLVIVAAICLVFSSAVAAKSGSHSVRGHVTKRGTYVPPHRATNPDKIKSNNWSQKGGVNPYTGKKGTKH